MLAAVADFYHWPRRELEALTAAEAEFWLSAAVALQQRRKAEGETGS